MEIGIIKNKSELEKVLSFFQEQGFSTGSATSWHDSKIRYIIESENVNKLNIKFDHQNDFIKSDDAWLTTNDKEQVLRKLYWVNDYDEVQKIAKHFFSKFTVNDKIDELLKHFSLEEDDTCTIPPVNSEPSYSDVDGWYKFRIKYGVDDSGDFYFRNNHRNEVKVFNFDKKSIKISGIKKYEGLHEFRKLYELLYGGTPLNFDIDNKGVWQDLGEIQLKSYKNGTTELSGNIKKFKDYFYNKIKKTLYTFTVVFHDGKKEFLEMDIKYKD